MTPTEKLVSRIKPELDRSSGRLQRYRIASNHPTPNRLCLSAWTSWQHQTRRRVLMFRHSHELSNCHLFWWIPRNGPRILPSKLCDHGWRSLPKTWNGWTEDPTCSSQSGRYFSVLHQFTYMDSYEIFAVFSGQKRSKKITFKMLLQKSTFFMPEKFQVEKMSV